MSNPLLLDIVLFLVSKSLCTGDGIDAFRDFKPEAPANIVCVFEYMGAPPVSYEDKVHRSVQVLVRNSNANEARQRCVNIFNQFHTESKLIHFTDTRWGQVSLRQTPFRLETDSLNRVTYCFNMGITTDIN
jgi:hypothetical protein